jgi:hypothetical protein
MLRLSMDVPLPLDVVELELELCGKRCEAKLASRDFAEDMVGGSCATEMVWKNGYDMVRLQTFITMLLEARASSTPRDRDGTVYLERRPQATPSPRHLNLLESGVMDGIIGRERISAPRKRGSLV